MTIYKEFKSPKKEFKIFNRAKRALSLSPKTKDFEKNCHWVISGLNKK